MLTSISKGYSLVKTKIGAITVPVDPEIPPTPVEEMVGATANIQEFDFGVITYRWQPPSGGNLETRTWISTPSRPGYTVGNERQQSDMTYLQWGKPPASVYTETVLIDMSNIIRDHAGNPVININMSGYWYTSVNTGDLNIELVTYKGGYMVDDSTFVWSNVGGRTVQILNLPVNTTMYMNGDSNGQDLAMLSYTVASKTGVLIRAIGAEPIEPPIEEPPVEGSPLMFRTSNFAGDSQELNVVMRLTNTEDDWRIIDNATDLTVMDRNSVQGLTNNVSTFRLNSPGDTDRDYRLEGSVTNLSLVIDEDYQANGSVTIDAFSDVISEYQLDVKSAEVTVPPILPAHVTTTENMFAGCTNFNQDISDWDTSRITNMKNMFAGCTSFNVDISQWDVSNVTTMEGTFEGCVSFNQDLSGWITDSLTDLTRTFKSCVLFNQSLSNWNTFNVNSLRECFSGAIIFNQPLDDWNVSNVTDMSFAFHNAVSFNQDLPNWNTMTVANFDAMFKDATLFNGNISTWDTSSALTMDAMFENAVSFDQPLNDWNVSQLTSMKSLFSGAIVFNQPLGNWDVSQLSGSFPMYRTFFNTTLFNQDLSSWCVPDIVYSSDFDNGAFNWTEPKPPWGYCGVDLVQSLDFTITTGDSAPADTYWKVDFMDGMSGGFEVFRDDVHVATSGEIDVPNVLNQYGNIELYVPPNTTQRFTIKGTGGGLKLAYYTTDAVVGTKVTVTGFSQTVLNHMFRIVNAVLEVPSVLPDYITSLTSMFEGSSSFSQDLSGWDTSNVTSFQRTFMDCKAFNGNITTWNTINATSFNRMFNSCNSFNQDISLWTVGSVLDMERMFSGCWVFNQDLSSWNVVNLPNKPYSFDSSAFAWLLPQPLWGTTGMPPLLGGGGLVLNCDGATGIVEFYIGDVSQELHYMVTIDGQDYNTDHSLNILSGFASIGNGLYFSASAGELPGDLATMVVYQDIPGDALRVKLTAPPQAADVNVITGVNDFSNLTALFDSESGDLEFCIVPGPAE